MSKELDKIITPEEYYKELINKENKTPEELMKIQRYEQYIRDCQDLDNLGLLPESAQKNFTKHSSNIINLITKENKTEAEKKAIENYQNGTEVNKKELEVPTRKLSKAGYVDATIILVVLLNIGFIIAMAILGR